MLEAVGTAGSGVLGRSGRGRAIGEGREAVGGPHERGHDKIAAKTADESNCMTFRRKVCSAHGGIHVLDRLALSNGVPEYKIHF